MQMSRFTAEGLSYSDACKLIDTLKTAGIDANITSGGVAVHPTPEQVNDAAAICKAAKAYYAPGYSMQQENVMLQTSDGWDIVERVTNNARAVVQEWKD
jgi:hypothetical protein